MQERPTAYKGNEPYSFVCYSHEDKASVYPELLRMERKGGRFWYDAGVSPASDWTEEIAHAIEGASRLLFFVSAASTASRHCRNEIQFALDRSIPVLVVYIEPVQLSGGLGLALGLSQAIRGDELETSEYQQTLNEALGLGELPMEPTASLPGSSENTRPWWFLATAVAVAMVALVLWSNTPLGKKQANEPTIAVLPFLDVGLEATQASLGLSIADQVLNTLARESAIRVIARTSSFRFRDGTDDAKQFGDKLGATHILEGTVVRESDQLVVTVGLMRIDTGTQVWSSRFERNLTDLFAMQRNIADAITGQLDEKLGPNHETLDSHISRQSIEKFLSAKKLIQEERSDEGLNLLREVVSREPTFLQAYLAILELQRGDQLIVSDIGWFNDPQEVFEYSKAIDRTLELDPGNPLAQIGRISLERAITNDVDWAAEELASVVRRHPNSSAALIALAEILHPEQRDMVIEQAEKLDPLNLRVMNMRAMSHAWSRNIEAASASFEALGAVYPNDPNTLRMRILMLVNLGELEKARALLGTLQLVTSERSWMRKDAELVLRRSDPVKVMAIRQEILETPGYPYFFRAMVSLTDESDLDVVIDLFEKSQVAREGNIRFIDIWVAWRAEGLSLFYGQMAASRLLENARFIDFQRKLGIYEKPTLENLSSLWD